jgi:hypothetical protein
MGILDALINGVSEIVAPGRRKKIKTIDPVVVKQALGEINILLVSASNPNWLQSGIQGAQQRGDGSFWQHAGTANRKGQTIEAFGNPRGVDYGHLDDYLQPGFQMIIFCLDFLSPESVAAIWQRNQNAVGLKYDEAEIIAHLLPAEFETAINDRKRPVCSSLAAVAAHPIFPIVKPKSPTFPGVNPWFASPGDIYDCLYPQRQVRIIKSGY